MVRSCSQITGTAAKNWISCELAFSGCNNCSRSTSRKHSWHQFDAERQFFSVPAYLPKIATGHIIRYPQVLKHWSYTCSNFKDSFCTCSLGDNSQGPDECACLTWLRSWTSKGSLVKTTKNQLKQMMMMKSYNGNQSAIAGEDRDWKHSISSPPSLVAKVV